MPSNWTRAEVEATVTDYFDMLGRYLRDEKYVKVEHYRRLAAAMGTRSQKSIEFKHANISAVLRDLGLLWIPGITPRSNYQSLLAEAVFDRVAGDADLLVLMQTAVDEPASDRQVSNHLIRLVDPPAPADVVQNRVEETVDLHECAKPPVNYFEREARNRSLGRAGEEFVVDFERERLAHAGADRLVDRVEHVAVTKGDGLGFDVRSFDEDGADRFIEVKTTRGGKETPFFVSRNELRVSLVAPTKYHLYRVFDFKHDPKLYWLRGSISDTCLLEPTLYSARVGSRLA